MKLRSPSFLVGLLLIILTFGAYWPVIQNGNFIWDDPEYVTHNMTLKRDDGLRDIWFNPSASPQYYPLVFTTFFIETRLYGDNPRGFIILNVLLHTASSYLLYLLLKKLNIPGAPLAAALFAVHPMTVESVAWITERKNTMAMLLSILAVNVYFSLTLHPHVKNGKRYGVIALATILFTLALLSKSAVCVVPPMLAIILWWKKKKLSKQDMAVVSAWFILSFLSGLLTALVEYHQVGANTAHYHLPPMEKILLITRNWWFYILQFAWPYPQSFFYPRWQIFIQNISLYGYILALIATWLLLWFWRRRLGLTPLIILLLYSLAIAPVLGVLNIYYFRFSYVADHFAYWALIPLCIGTALLVFLVADKWPFLTPRIRTIIGVILVVACAGLTWNRGHVYESWTTLFADTVQKSPACADAWALYADGLIKEKKFAQAKENLLIAYHMQSDRVMDAGQLANICLMLGQIDEAEKYAAVLAEKLPQFADTWLILGVLRERQKRIPEAIACYVKSHTLSAGNGNAIYNAGVLLANLGDFQKAEDCFRMALAVNPRWAQAYNMRGRCLAMLNHLHEAKSCFEQASKLDPNPEFRDDLQRIQQVLTQSVSSRPSLIVR